jgi:hydroxypyruvate isomerase
MAVHSLPYLANCSLLFTEHPLMQRAAAAKAAGFDAVEFWWPFDRAVPGDAEVDAFVASILDAGVDLVALNFFAGDLAGPDCGLLSIPERSGEFRDNVEVTVEIGSRLGARGFNAPYGNRVTGASADEQDELATDNLVLATSAAARIGATVLIEAVSGPKPYPLRRAADAVAVVDRVRATGATNIGFLCDLYHLAVNGDDIDAAIRTFTPKIAHVQIADAPGRGEPGSGDLDLEQYLAALQAAGYDGWVSLEYKPTVPTVESLAWLPKERRGAPAGRLRSNGRSDVGPEVGGPG